MAMTMLFTLAGSSPQSYPYVCLLTETDSTCRNQVSKFFSQNWDMWTPTRATAADTLSPSASLAGVAGKLIASWALSLFLSDGIATVLAKW